VNYKQSDGNLVALNSADFSYTTVAGAITVSSATRSVTSVGATGVTYKITFTIGHRMLSGNILKFEFPDDQLVYDAGIVCQNGLNSVTLSPACTVSFAGTTTTVSVTQWCSVGAADCAAGS